MILKYIPQLQFLHRNYSEFCYQTGRVSHKGYFKISHRRDKPRNVFSVISPLPKKTFLQCIQTSSLPSYSRMLSYSFCLSVLVFWDRVSLYCPSCPKTHCVHQAGLLYHHTKLPPYFWHLNSNRSATGDFGILIKVCAVQNSSLYLIQSC